FRDAKSVLANSGTALMSNGIASGENKAEEAVKKALDSPLLNDNKITGARNVLLLIRSGSEEVTMDEIGVIMDHIQKEAGNTADIIFGVGTDEELGDAVSVLVIATGFAKEHEKHSGISEKIKISLSDTISPKGHQESPFNYRDSREEMKREERKGLFVLDDEDDAPAPNSGSRTPEARATSGKTQSSEAQFFSLTETELPEQTFNLNTPERPVDLFSFDQTNDFPESQAITFEFDTKPADNEADFFKIEEKNEINFFVNEPTEEPKAEIAQPKAQASVQPVPASETIVEKTEEKSAEVE